MAMRRIPCVLLKRIPTKNARPFVALNAPSRGLATAKPPSSLFTSLDTFTDRHVGPDDKDVARMLSQLGYDSLEAFIADTVPPKIRVSSSVVSNESIPALSESELLQRARELGQANTAVKSYIGMGYHNAVVPPVILRNVRVT